MNFIICLIFLVCIVEIVLTVFEIKTNHFYNKLQTDKEFHPDEKTIHRNKVISKVCSIAQIAVCTLGIILVILNIYLNR